MYIDEGYGVKFKSGGREYIDLTSGGIFAAIMGNDFSGEKIEFPGMVSCYGHTNKWTERYKDQLKEFTGFESVALFSTGSEATEAFWRCMRVYTGRKGII